MFHPINAPRFQVIRTQDGKHVATCSTDSLNWFPVGIPRDGENEAISDAVNLSIVTATNSPVGIVVWRDAK